MVMIGSARVDENGKYANGKPGDQKQVSTPDCKGEVSKQSFYVSQKGWDILRPKHHAHAEKIARAMSTACDNPCIGYSQSDRYSILKVGTATKTNTNCDCSSLVRQCVKEGTGTDPGDFNTSNEANKLLLTGLFEKLVYQKGMSLYPGDVLVTRTKGHTVIVIDGDEKKEINEIAREVIAGKWGTGIDRQNRLNAAGYDYAEVQATVNRMLKG